MAYQVKNKKGFLIIRATLAELCAAEPVPQPGICDCCGNATLQGYIIGVLGHRWYCPECYKKWLARAENYPEDKDFELAVFNEYRNRFAAAGIWNDIKTGE